LFLIKASIGKKSMYEALEFVLLKMLHCREKDEMIGFIGQTEDFFSKEKRAK